MANAIKWAAASSRGTVLTTELNSLASAALSGVGSVLDNATNKDQYGRLELNVTFGSSPAAGGYVDIYEVIAPDGTNYGSAAAVAQLQAPVASIAVNASTSAQRVASALFAMSPFLTKYLLVNRTSVSFPASGTTVNLYTTNDEIQ